MWTTLSLRLGDGHVTLSELVSRVQIWAEAQLRDSSALLPVAAEGGEGALERGNGGILRFADGGIVSLDVMFLGTEVELGEFAGWWVVVDASRGSLCLLQLFLVTACVAQLSGQAILDDSHLLGLGTWVEVDEILGVMSRVSGMTAADAEQCLRTL